MGKPLVGAATMATIAGTCEPLETVDRMGIGTRAVVQHAELVEDQRIEAVGNRPHALDVNHVPAPLRASSAAP